MRALLPRSASAMTTARIGSQRMWRVDYTTRSGALLQAGRDHVDDRALRGAESGVIPRPRFNRADGCAVHVGVENRGMDVALAADRSRVTQPLGHRFHCFHDIALRFRI